MDGIGAGGIGAEGGGVTAGSPAAAIAAPGGVAVGVGNVGGQGDALTGVDLVGAVGDGNGGRVSLHGHLELGAGVGAVDLNARFDGVGTGVVALEGVGAAVGLQLAVDGPLQLGGIVVLLAQLDKAGDGHALALLDGHVGAVKLDLDAGVVEHRLDGLARAGNYVHTLGIGDAVAPFIENIALGCHGGNGDAVPLLRLDFQRCYASLSVAGQAALAFVLHLIAVHDGFRRGGGGRRGNAYSSGSALGDIVGIRAAVVGLVGVVHYVVCQGGGTRAGQPAAGEIGVLPIAGVGL